MHPTPSGSVVMVLRDGQTAGTGFAVATDLVVTCAHVLGRAKVGDEATLVGAASPYQAVVVSITDAQDLVVGKPYPWPDLAILRHDGFDTPTLALARDVPPQASSLVTYGFTDGYVASPSFVGRHAVTLAEERSEAGWAVLECESEQPITGGFSGAPLLDETSGLVVGMVKYADQHSVMALPSPVLLHLVEPYAASAAELIDPHPRVVASLLATQAYQSVGALWSIDGELLGTAVVVLPGFAVTSSAVLEGWPADQVELSIDGSATRVVSLRGSGAEGTLTVLELTHAVGSPLSFAQSQPLGDRFDVSVYGATPHPKFGHTVNPISFRYAGTPVTPLGTGLVQVVGGFSYEPSHLGGAMVDARNQLPFALADQRLATIDGVGLIGIPFSDKEIRDLAVELGVAPPAAISPAGPGPSWDYLPTLSKYLDQLEAYSESAPTRWRGLTFSNREQLHQEVLLREHRDFSGVTTPPRPDFDAEDDPAPTTYRHYSYQMVPWDNREPAHSSRDGQAELFGTRRVRWADISRTSGHIAVLGDPGSGKTWLLEREVRIACEISRGRLLQRTRMELPLLIRATDLGPVAAAGTLPAILRAAVGLGNDADPGMVLLRRWLTADERQHDLLICVDGIDEVATSDRAAVQAVLTNLARLAGVRLIVSSRWSGYVSPFPDGVRAVQAELLSFQPRDSVDFIVRALAPEPAADLVTLLQHDSVLQELARNPLTLTMLCVAAVKGLIPPTRVELFGMIVKELVRTEVEDSTGLRCDIDDVVRRCASVFRAVADRHAWGAYAGTVQLDALVDEVTASDEMAIRHAVASAVRLLAQPGSTAVRYLHRTLIEYLVASDFAQAGPAGLAAALGHVWYEDDWYATLPLLGAMVSRAEFGGALAACHPDTGYVLGMMLADADAAGATDRRLANVEFLSMLWRLPGRLLKPQVLRLLQGLGGEVTAVLASEHDDSTELSEVAALLGYEPARDDFDWVIFDGEADPDRRLEVAEALARTRFVPKESDGSDTPYQVEAASERAELIRAFHAAFRVYLKASRALATGSDNHLVRTHQGRDVEAAVLGLIDAAEALVALREPASVQAVMTFVRRRKYSVGPRASLVDVLAGVAIPLTTRALEELILESDELPILISATEGLGRRPSPATLSKLRGLLTADEVMVTERCSLAQALGWEVVHDLEEALLADASSSIRGVEDPHIGILLDGCRRGSGLCGRRLQQLVEHAVSRVVVSQTDAERRRAEELVRQICAACSAVGEVEPEWCVAELSRLVQASGLSWASRARVVQALSDLRVSEAGKVLVRLATESPTIATTAVDALRRRATLGLTRLEAPVAKHWLRRVASATALPLEHRLIATRALVTRVDGAAARRTVIDLAPAELAGPWLELAAGVLANTPSEPEDRLVEGVRAAFRRRNWPTVVRSIGRTSGNPAIHDLAQAADALLAAGQDADLDEVLAACGARESTVEQRRAVASVIGARLPARAFAIVASLIKGQEGFVNDADPIVVGFLHDAALASLPRARAGGDWEIARAGFESIVAAIERRLVLTGSISRDR